MKNLAELLQLSQKLPEKDRSRRIALIKSFSSLMKQTKLTAEQLGGFDVFGPAIWIVADSRKTAELIQIMMVTARDVQYRCRCLLDNKDVPRRRDTTADPGRAIAEFLALANIKPAELARLFKKDEAYVLDLVSNMRPITVEVAKLLEEATASSAESWLSLQILYSLNTTPEVPIDTALVLRERFRSS